MDPFASISNAVKVDNEEAGLRLFSPDDDRAWIEIQLREGIKVMLEEIREAEMAAHLGVDKSERSTEGRGYWNGSYTRGLTTRMGKVELSVPRDLEGTSSPAPSSGIGTWNRRWKRLSWRPIWKGRARGG